MPNGIPNVGARPFPIPFGTVYSTNITQYKQTGLGNCTDQQIADAITKGIRRDGSRILPVMAYEKYSGMARDDLQALIARVGARVADYYRRAHSVICLETSTVQPIRPNWSPEGLPRTVESELRVDLEATDGDALPEIEFQFRFRTTLQNEDTFLYNTGPITSLTDPSWNKRQLYSVSVVRGNGGSIYGKVFNADLACFQADHLPEFPKIYELLDFLPARANIPEPVHLFISASREREVRVLSRN